MGCVYVETCIPNGKIYVGQTTRNYDAYRRKRFTDAKHTPDRGRLYGAILKYGPESFVGKVLVESNDQDQLHKLEQFFIRTLESQHRNIGYNVTAGGDGFRAKPSAAHLQKLRISHLGKVPWNKGKSGVYSAETIAKMSANRRGKPGRLGVKHSPEVRAKLSAAHRGKKWTEKQHANKAERYQKISQTHRDRGIKPSKEAASRGGKSIWANKVGIAAGKCYPGPRNKKPLSPALQ